MCFLSAGAASEPVQGIFQAERRGFLSARSTCKLNSHPVRLTSPCLSRDHNTSFRLMRRSGRRDPSGTTVPPDAANHAVIRSHALPGVPGKPRRAARVYTCFKSSPGSCPREDGALGHQSSGGKSPQRHQELARQSDDCPFPRPPVAEASAMAERSFGCVDGSCERRETGASGLNRRTVKFYNLKAPIILAGVTSCSPLQ